MKTERGSSMFEIIIEKGMQDQQLTTFY
ncbi:uncharacterized protein FFMR_02390 [Fusarium fujikuroi]|nr:uncharacterized protein FFE2_04375 [Fusarium fujikuroi]SCN97541.1 uncharacterized protein FFC1_07961 [Fusarium fujikuroi]SCO32344.1 uncharacterized protein FFMR_02390 [Fusarium fujikuroi]